MNIEINRKETSTRGKKNNFNSSFSQIFPEKGMYRPKEKEELLTALRQVKKVMDGEVYQLDFDGLYDMVSGLLDRYDNKANR